MEHIEQLAFRGDACKKHPKPKQTVHSEAFVEVASTKCRVASSKLGPKLDSVQGCCELRSCGKRIITMPKDTAQCKKPGG